MQRSIEDRYGQWNRAIHERVGLVYGALYNAAFTESGLLVPQGDNEFTEEEQDDLFETVRFYLWFPRSPSTHSDNRIIVRIKSLSPQDSVPLLYACRVIARRFGRRGRYWPDFTRHLLGGDADGQQELLAFAQQRLAPQLGDCWRRLGRETGARLYEPRQGRINIKWPLAHAGLLAAEQQRIRAFGAALYREANGDADLAPLGDEDFPAFRDALTEWVAEQGVADFLYDLLVTSGDDGDDGKSGDADRSVVLCEIAQRLIAREWDDLGRLAADLSPSPMNFYPRLKLRLNAAERRLRFGVTRAVLQGPITGLSLNATFAPRPDEKPETFSIPLGVTGSSGGAGARTISYAKADICHGPVFPGQTVWAQTLVKRGASQSVEARKRQIAFAPQPETGGTLLFRMDTGEAAETLEPGEAYYLVGPRACLSLADAARQSARTTLFETHYDYGALSEPDWSDYQIVAAQVRTVPALASFADRHEFAQSWAKAADLVGVAGSGDLWRVRLVLFGERIASGVTTANDAAPRAVYRCDAPPYAVLHGDAAGRTLFLERTNGAGNAQQTEIARIVVATDRAAFSSDFLDLFDGAVPAPGNYRVRINHKAKYKTLCEFSLTNAPAPPLADKSVPMTIGLECRPVTQGWGAARSSKQGSMDELRRSELRVSGWPFAALQMNVYQDGSGVGAPAAAFPCALDASGRAVMRWRDTGLDNLLADGGGVRIEAQWNGLIRSQTLVFADQACIADGGIRLYNGKAFLRIEGRVHQAKTQAADETAKVTEVTIAIIGAAPWDGDLWTQVVPLDETGAFFMEWLRVFAPRWVAVYGTGANAAPFSPHVRNADRGDAVGKSAPLSLPELLNGRTWEAWTESAKNLRVASLPVDLLALIPHFHVDDLGAWKTLLRQWQGHLHYKRQPRRWFPLNTVQRAEAIWPWASIHPNGSPWRFAPFLNERVKRPQAGYLYENIGGGTVVWRDDLLSAEAPDFAWDQEIALYTGGEPNGNAPVAWLTPERDGERAFCRFRPALEAQCGCRSCGVVGSAQNVVGEHSSPFAGRMCPGNPTVRIPVPDRGATPSGAFVLCALWSPLHTFDAVLQLLKTLQTDKPAAPPARFASVHEELGEMAYAAADAGDVADVNAYLDLLLACLTELRSVAWNGRTENETVEAFLSKYTACLPAVQFLTEWFAAEMETMSL